MMTCRTERRPHGHWGPHRSVCVPLLPVLLLLLFHLCLSTHLWCVAEGAAPVEESYSLEELDRFAEESQQFMARRASAGPHVHQLRVRDAATAAGSHAVLVEVLETAEDTFAARRDRLLAAGVSRQQRWRRPVCGLSALTPEEAAAGVRLLSPRDPGAPPAIVEFHMNITDCRGGPDADLTNAPPIHSTDTHPYISQSPAVYGASSDADAKTLPAGLKAALRLMPVGERWRLDIPAELAFGRRGAGAGHVHTPPNCRITCTVRVVHVTRGEAALPECRQALRLAFGYDIYEKSRQLQGGEKDGHSEEGESAVVADKKRVAATAPENAEGNGGGDEEDL